jgi:transcriptional regulator with XRE-family HTH domain
MAQNADMSGKYDRLAVMIARAREARGWSQADLAQLSYMSDAAIANVEAGRPSSRVALSAVEQALGWLPGMFDFVLGQGPEAEAEPDGAGPGTGDGAAGEEYGDDYEDDSEQTRELVADSTIDWA